MIEVGSFAAQAYVLDSGHRTALQGALDPVVCRLRDDLEADVALVLYQPYEPGGLIRALASSAQQLADLPLANEPLLLNQRIPVRQPTALTDVEIASAVRSYRVWLRSAIAIPWRDQYGAGILLIGNTTPTPVAVDLAMSEHRRGGRAVKYAMHQGRLTGAMQLRGDLDRSLKDVAEASVNSASAALALAQVLASARNLFGSEVAYLAVSDDDNETFTFDQTLGIKTSAFRHLRMSFGQGLGGLARSVGKTVRSIDYATDGRLMSAPVQETVAEGLVSAMATPLVIDDELKGVLYVGNRHLRSFTDFDERLLTEFGGYATLGLKRRSVDEYRASVVDRQVRERMAVELHDSVVRGLLEIGFRSEHVPQNDNNEALRSRLAVIGQAAESCIEALRETLAVLHAESVRQPVHPSEILRRLEQVQRRREVARTCTWLGERPMLNGRVADALLAIAEEAIFNAEIHSGCRQEHVALHGDSRSIHLTIADDGCGLDPPTLDRILGGSTGHLGFRAMRAAATRVGGHLSVRASPSGGLAVHVILPLNPA